MEKYYFDETQPRVTVGDGVVLLLINGREEKEVMSSMPDMDGMATTELVERKVWVYDGVRLETGGMTSEAALTAAAQKMVLAEIEQHDASPSVNSFVLDGQRVWLDFELRDRVYQGNERLKNVGREETTLWFGDKCYNMSIEQAQSIISHIEAYAKDCYNATAQHKANVSAMKTVEDVLGYDYTKGYPEKLTISLSEKGKVKSEKSDGPC